MSRIYIVVLRLKWYIRIHCLSYSGCGKVVEDFVSGFPITGIFA
jgi:hypothetical protein